MAGMFSRRSLEKHGRRARATVLETLKLTSSKSPASETSVGTFAGVKETWEVRIRVDPDGEQPFELQTKITFPRENGKVKPGLLFPVLYDPDDHDEVMYDPAPMDDAQIAALTMESRGLDRLIPQGLGTSEEFIRQWQADPKAQREEIRRAAAAGQAPAGAVSPEMLAAMQAAALWAAPQAAPGPAPDPVERLAKLADLRDRGALTDAEFEAQKARILSEG
jgi:hypothetical protein